MMAKADESQGFQLFAGGGEMGALMRAMDWTKTRLGPVQSWPKSLRTVVGVLLGSRFPMMIWWGPELLNLYNDAYRPILRGKHPASLGAPAAELWAEVWDFAGPLARSVLAGGPATWMEDVQLFIRSGDMAEETYFTFSYSPIPGDDGRVGGLLNTVQETTAKVQSERQIRMLYDLAAQAVEAKSEAVAFRVVSDVLTTNELDLPFFMIYARRGNEVELVAGNPWNNYSGPARPQRAFFRSVGMGWPFAEVIRTGRDVVVDDLSARFGELPKCSWGGRPDRGIVLALHGAGQSESTTFLVAGLSPHRVFDERYHRFFRATADQVASIINNALAYELQAQLLKAQKLESVGQLAAGIAHEINTPAQYVGDNLHFATEAMDNLLELIALQQAALECGLGQDREALIEKINARAEAADIEYLSKELPRALTECTDGMRHVSRIVRALKAFAHPGSSDHIEVDLNQAIENTLMVCRGEWKYHAEIETELDPDLPHVLCLAGEINQVFLNLIVNAAHAIADAKKADPERLGRIRISTHTDDTWVEVRIGDTGTGIPPAVQGRIFDPFFTTKEVGRGTGQGLAIAHDVVVRKHSGTVTFETQEGVGTTFSVRLPLRTKHRDEASE